MQNKKLGFGIIGCGVIADFHANALFELSDSAEIIGVADVNYDAAEKFANRHGIKAFSNPQELLACADVDIVNICTPSGYHASCVEEAAKAGKHIIVEKPWLSPRSSLMRSSGHAERTRLC